MSEAAVRSAAATIAALLTLVCADPARAGQAENCAADSGGFAAGYDYVLGAQAFGGHLQLAKDHGLQVQANELRALGSNVLKISLGRPQAAKYGFAAAARGARSELEYVKAAPGLQKVLDMDFKYYLFWVQSFTDSDWRDGVSDTEARLYYYETYDLAAWLLKRYSGTGKIFMFGNWEGDWQLDGGQGNRSVPSQQAIDGMVVWYNIRQKAIEDAKAATHHNDVELYQYAEANLVKRALEGTPSLALSVLPRTNVDMVSYSSYEAIRGPETPDIDSVREQLTRTTDFLERQLRPKTGLPFPRRVFIGEYGHHANRNKPLTVQQQFLKSRDVMQVSLELDLPFALIWQLYNNERAPDGTSQEMSLIDEAGRKRALYFLHQQYLAQMRRFVADTCRSTGKAPSRGAFKTQALEVLEALSYEKMQQMADDAERSAETAR